MSATITSRPPIRAEYGHHPAIVDPGEMPGHVRNNQPDEADRAAGGGRRAGQQHHRGDTHDLVPQRMHAQRCGHVVAQLQQVQTPAC